MPFRSRKGRKPLGFFDAQDKVIGLRHIYQTAGYGSDRARTLAKSLHEDLSDATLPEPDAEMEDSDLSDAERHAAIIRERARRAGLT